jgi:3-oxoacyl-[acyl-carrier-protein] synthase II
MKRVVITGVGVVSPVGSTKETFWDSLVNGRGGIHKITKFDVSAYSSQIGGEVKGLDIEKYIPSRKERRRMDEFCQYAIAASKMAAEDSGIDFASEDPTMMGAVIGSGIGGIQLLQDQDRVIAEKGPSRASPFLIPMMISNIVPGMVAIEYNLQGPNFSVVTACATAAHSIGDAYRIIERGESNIMFAGGSEASIAELGLAGFCSMKALSTRNDSPETASRPFDLERDGFIMGEGGGVVILEEYEHAKARGADIYCEISGFGMTCDAHHITAPMDTGDGARRAILKAMSDSGFNPEDIDYINAHGTSTPLNDKTETAGIKGALGDAAYKTMVSSTKSMTGHLLGAAAGVETIACCMAIKYGIIPPTINYTTPDPLCDLDYVPNEARETEVKACLNNSLGFGGHNACLAFKAL